MLTTVNIDTILSDPLLLTASTLLVIGPLLFLVSLWNLIRSPKKKDPLFEEVHDIVESPPPAPIKEAPTPPALIKTPSVPIPSASIDSERTVVLPPGVAEIQGQLEIAFSQIKLLNKKVIELENIVSSGGTNPSLDSASGGGTPSNVQDLAQKLLKLAEHVITLEKNVNRLMTNKNIGSPSETASAKPPIMPL